MPSSRRPRASRTGTDSPRDAAKPATGAAASPWGGGSLPLIPLTILAAAAGMVLIVLFVLTNGGGRTPAGALASGSPGASSGATASGPASPSASAPSGSAGPAVSGPPIEAPVRTTPPDLAFGRNIGSPAAPVQMEIWSDFQCPACDAFAGSVEPYLIDTYIRPGLARLTYHDIATIGEESLGASISARCADQQGKFWQYHDLLFANQAPENSGAFTRERSLQFAQSLGLDLNAFTACLDNTDVENAVQTETLRGLSSGVSETPTLFVDGKIVKPATSSEAIDAAIAAALKASSAAPAASSAP